MPRNRNNLIDRTIQQNNASLLQAIAMVAGELLTSEELLQSKDLQFMALAMEYQATLRQEQQAEHPPIILATIDKRHCMVPLNLTIEPGAGNGAETYPDAPAGAASYELHLQANIRQNLPPPAQTILNEYIARSGAERTTSISATADSLTDLNRLADGHLHLSIHAGQRLEETYGPGTVQEVVRRIIRRQRRATGHNSRDKDPVPIETITNHSQEQTGGRARRNH